MDFLCIKQDQHHGTGYEQKSKKKKKKVRQIDTMNRTDQNSEVRYLYGLSIFRKETD